MNYFIQLKLIIIRDADRNISPNFKEKKASITKTLNQRLKFRVFVAKLRYETLINCIECVSISHQTRSLSTQVFFLIFQLWFKK
jgi:hypothetical protein